MSLNRHCKLLLYASIGWLVFVLIGLPNYYRDWSFMNLLYLCIATYFAVGLIIYNFILKYNEGFVWALWIAFYITIPLIFYDLLYIKFILKEPFDLLNRFWFLSVFYIIPWIQAPILYWYSRNLGMNKKFWGLIVIICFVLAIFMRSQWATFEGSFFDTMADYPERNSTMLGSSLKYSLYGTMLSLGIMSLIRIFAPGRVR